MPRNDRDLDKDPREDRLPVWVRDKLATLRMRAREARDAADAQLGEGKRSNVWLRAAHSNDLEFLQSRFDQCRFYVGPSDHDWLILNIRGQAGASYLEITALDEIMIIPSASNQLHVTPARTFLADPPRHMQMQIRGRKR